MIGAGVIGLELGSVYARLGAKVTVIEYLDRILPGMDLEVAKNFQRLLQKQGFTFKLSSKVTSATKAKSGVTLQVEPTAGGAAESLEADMVLVAVGRVPFTEGLGSRRPASSAMARAASRWATIMRPASRASMPSAT